MVCEISSSCPNVGDGSSADYDRHPLLPDRYPTGDLFVCDIFDAAPKADLASMEHPIFSLSTKPDLRARRYEHGGHFVEIIPSVKGLATVHDRDVLIYCISQLIAALNKGAAIAKTVRLKAYDLLKSTNRQINGQSYEGLKASLERLRGTQINTNIITGGKEELNIFGLIDSAKILRQTRDGRMIEIEITLSDWVFNAIQAKEVLTLNRDYFRLRKPLERRIYELARKHCGNQKEWSISMDLLQKKCGSSSTSKEFNRLIKSIVRQDQDHHHFPDYSLDIDGERLTVTSRGTIRKRQSDDRSIDASYPLTEAMTAAARVAAPGLDPYSLHADWIHWWRDGGSVPLQNPAGAFIGFCRNRFERSRA